MTPATDDGRRRRDTMARNPLAAETTPELQDVLDALGDPDCRTILRHLDEPLSAGELVEATGIAESTVYRKLDRLSEAELVEESTEVRRDGHHTSRYECTVERVVVSIDEDREFELTVERPEPSPDERLAALWSEVRREA